MTTAAFNALLNQVATVTRLTQAYDELRRNREIEEEVGQVRVRIDRKSAPGVSGQVPAEAGIIEGSVPDQVFLSYGEDVQVGDYLEIGDERWRIISLVNPGGVEHHLEGWIIHV